MKLTVLHVRYYAERRGPAWAQNLFYDPGEKPSFRNPKHQLTSVHRLIPGEPYSLSAKVKHDTLCLLKNLRRHRGPSDMLERIEELSKRLEPHDKQAALCRRWQRCLVRDRKRKEKERKDNPVPGEDYVYIEAAFSGSDLHWRYQVAGMVESRLMHDEDVRDWSNKDIVDLTMRILDVPAHQRGIIQVTRPCVEMDQ